MPFLILYSTNNCLSCLLYQKRPNRPNNLNLTTAQKKQIKNKPSDITLLVFCDIITSQNNKIVLSQNNISVIKNGVGLEPAFHFKRSGSLIDQRSDLI